MEAYILKFPAIGTLLVLGRSQEKGAEELKFKQKAYSVNKFVIWASWLGVYPYLTFITLNYCCWFK